MEPSAAINGSNCSGHPNARGPHHNQRLGAHCPSCRRMGKRMARANRPSKMRQLGGCSHPQLGQQPGSCGDASHAMPSVHPSKFQIDLFASHIPGLKNNLADALSRNNLSHFKCHYPQAAQDPTPLPQELLDITLVSKPDWTLAPWTDLWSAIFAMD